MKYFRIIIKGIVQGVGFRPFLYNLARKHEIKGAITNKGNIGVEMIVSSTDDSAVKKIENFVNEIGVKKPSISYIEEITRTEVTPRDIESLGYDQDEIDSGLHIKPSVKGRGMGLTLPPDIAICDDCLREMWDPNNNRYYEYPFIACAECGPRYTTVTDLPYDRERTTMRSFPFCTGADSCKTEYETFTNRRFHAQTFSCKIQGPNYYLLVNPNLLDKSDFETSIGSSDLDYNGCLPENYGHYKKNSEYVANNAHHAVQAAAKLIKKGKIGAIMGIGGVHLVCSALDENAVSKLRSRKRDRKYKPLAIMVSDISVAKKYTHITKKEEDLLRSFRRPIVLVDKKIDDIDILSDIVAPGLPNIGIILPYAGIHHLLFKYTGNIPLIFTSGNISHIPMAIKPEQVLKQLKSLADFYLLHNREIYQRCDDSVLRVNGVYEKLIRRSRGYVPEYIPLPFETKVNASIAVGPELNSTGAVAKGYRIFPTQHIGHGTSVEAYEFLQKSLNHMRNLLQINDDEVDIIAHDMHPLFNSTRLAEELSTSLSDNREIFDYAVQHHYAHAASLMVDCNVAFNDAVVVASLDGVGYGDDGNVWGGEIVYGKYYNLKRGSRFEYIPMIGGDRCVEWPVRMLIGFLIKAFGIQKAIELSNKMNLEEDLEYKKQELDSIFTAYESNHNVALSSSCGRLLDAISALLNICTQKTYRGEPAMRLEGSAYGGDPKKYDFFSDLIKTNNKDLPAVIESHRIIVKIIAILKRENLLGERKRLPRDLVADLSASVLYSIGKIFAYYCVSEARRYGIDKIGLSGGVSYNGPISESFYQYIKAERQTSLNLELLEHRTVPPGDAGVSIGQIAVAIAKYKVRGVPK